MVCIECFIWIGYKQDRSPPCHTKSNSRGACGFTQSVSPPVAPECCFYWFPRRPQKRGRRRSRGRKGLHIARQTCRLSSLKRESVAKEKCTKPPRTQVNRGRRGGAGFLCVCFNESEGCEPSRQPLPHAFIGHLLLSSGRMFKKLVGGFSAQPHPNHTLSQVSALQFNRCAHL